MSQTKGDVINNAFEQLRISGLTVSASPGEVQAALNTLESMAAEFAGRNITTHYRVSPAPDPSEQTGLDAKYWFMFSSNLATRIAPNFGKTISPELRANSSASLSSVSAMIAAETVRQVMPGGRVPIGDANSLRNRWHQRFFRENKLPPENAELNHMFIGDINDYIEDYTSYLKVGENITSTEFLVDQGIKLLQSDFDSPYVSYEIQAVSQVMNGVWQQVRIIITTNLGRKSARLINFAVQVPATMEGISV